MSNKTKTNKTKGNTCDINTSTRSVTDVGQMVDVHSVRHRHVNINTVWARKKKKFRGESLAAERRCVANEVGIVQARTTGAVAVDFDFSVVL